MTTETESVSGLFEQAFDNLRKAAESNVEMQQELFRKWNTNWPGFPQPQSAWVERVHKFQKAWTKTAEEAFRVAQSSDPQEYGKRCEALCRKSLDVLRETGELQVKEMQEALNKWTELAAKSTS